MNKSIILVNKSSRYWYNSIILKTMKVLFKKITYEALHATFLLLDFLLHELYRCVQHAILES